MAPGVTSEAGGRGGPSWLEGCVRDAVRRLDLAGSVVTVECPVPGEAAVEVRHGNRAALVVDAAALATSPPWLAAAEARARAGELGLVVVGTDAPLEALTARGVFDVVEDAGSLAALALAVRNALEGVGLRRDAASSTRWLRRVRYELDEMSAIARALTHERDTTRLLRLILEKCRYLTGADAASIYVVERDATGPRALRFKLSQNESTRFSMSEFVLPLSAASIAGAVALRREPLIIDDVYNLPASVPWRFDPSFDARTGYRTRSMLTVPLVSAEGEALGVVQLINKKADPRARLYTPEDVARVVVPFDDRSAVLVYTVASQAAIALENAWLYDEIRKILDGFVRASVQAIEQRDPTTSGHSVRVSRLACALARELAAVERGPYAGVRYAPNELKQLEYASLLHDFGKIGVREHVLLKEKKLHGWQLAQIRTRFDYVRAALERDAARRRCELVAAGADEGALDALERDLAARVGEVEGSWSLVTEANEPTVLAHGTFETIEAIAQRSYVDPRGHARPFLVPEEVVALKVPRGSLTPGEIDEIRGHVAHTYEFLTRIPWGKTFAQVPAIAGSHHERMNGRGYPRGLRGEEIPLGGRIMAVADVFDALTAADRPYKRAVPVDRALGILEGDAQAGHLEGELVRIFIEHEVFRALEA